MQLAVTKLGLVRQVTYDPRRRRLRAVLLDESVHEVDGIEPSQVQGPTVLTDSDEVERLVNESLPWRPVTPIPTRHRSRAVRELTRIQPRIERKRMNGKFRCPLGLVNAVMYDRASGRLRLALSDRSIFESDPLPLDAARALMPVLSRERFLRLFGLGGAWRPLPRAPSPLVVTDLKARASLPPN